jgi:hypothetical protein
MFDFIQKNIISFYKMALLRRIGYHTNSSGIIINEMLNPQDRFPI